MSHSLPRRRSDLVPTTGWRRRLRRFGAAAACLAATAGCQTERAQVGYLGEADDRHYKAIATEIDHPAILTPRPPEVALTQPPHTIAEQTPSELWDLTLSEAIRLALANSEVLRSNGTFLSGGQVLNGPDQAAATFDPAIQESNVGLGQRGVEAALADFDAQFSTQMTWGRNESLSNTPFAGDGGLDGPLRLGESINDSGNFSAGLSKVFAYGGQMQLQHNVSYAYNNSPFNFFPSNYTGSASLSYRQPLLAGAGTEYTRIAGPITQNFSGLGPQAGGIFGGGAGLGGGGLGINSVQLGGVSNGVVIARINNDLTLADFERSVRDHLRDVEQVYWDLYLAYRQYDTTVIQRNASLETWRVAKIRRDLEGDILPAEEAQARDQYFSSRALAESARSRIFETETRLRRLLNLPASDGRVIRPIDEPTTALVRPDWFACLGQALASRVELRRQKWNIKSLQLQRTAAQSLLQPRLDFVSSYQVNGFGDTLLGDDDNIPGRNFYETLGNNDQTGWQLGIQFSVPIGNRVAYAQEQNITLRLSKAQKVLAAAEHEISQELANAFQELARTRATMVSQFARRDAAIENVALLEPLFEEGQITLDELLRAQARRGDAESAYFDAITSYNQAILNLEYRKGTLLPYDNVLLAEGAWSQCAHFDAHRRGKERAHAHPAPRTEQLPAPFASPFYAGDETFPVPGQPDAGNGTPVVWDAEGELVSPKAETLPAPELEDLGDEDDSDNVDDVAGPPDEEAGDDRRDEEGNGEDPEENETEADESDELETPPQLGPIARAWWQAADEAAATEAAVVPAVFSEQSE